MAMKRLGGGQVPLRLDDEAGAINVERAGVASFGSAHELERSEFLLRERDTAHIIARKRRCAIRRTKKIYLRFTTSITWWIPVRTG